MGKISVGSVVFVQFPFSDLSHAKLRPAFVLAYAERNDWILCQITSKSYADSMAIQIQDDDFEMGGLSLVSYIRPAKIFTANESVIEKSVGILKSQIHEKVVAQLISLFKVGN
ncbi:MAG: type II toxin-antitoxin system PemK/MazF family toxin [Thiotrichaceae bacterium]|nr:type II toxin-antitoxin system PemK/MazF family toxin [Thiotrichaceae bacterium]